MKKRRPVEGGGERKPVYARYFGKQEGSIINMPLRGNMRGGIQAAEGNYLQRVGVSGGMSHSPKRGGLPVGVWGTKAGLLMTIERAGKAISKIRDVIVESSTDNGKTRKGGRFQKFARGKTKIRCADE